MKGRQDSSPRDTYRSRIDRVGKRHPRFIYVCNSARCSFAGAGWCLLTNTQIILFGMPSTGSQVRIPPMFWCFFESESRVSHPRSCSLDSRESAGSSARRTAGIRHTAPAVREQVKAACRQQAAQAPRAIVAAVCSQLGASSCDCVAPRAKTDWHTSAAAVALAVLLVVACEVRNTLY